MSMTASEGVNMERPEMAAFVKRSFEAEVTPGDGRTIDVRIVPYGIPTEVSDGGPLYREMWMQGAFSDQVRGARAGRAREVYVNFEHGQTMADVLGRGEALRESDDGFYGSFRILNSADGDKTLELVNDGALNGISLEARVKKSVRMDNGVVQRMKAHLVNVALCRNPAYQSAGVLAVREEDLMVDEDDDEMLAMISLPDEIRERCRRIGIVPPDEVVDIVERAFTERPWDGSSSRWPSVDEYCSASVIDLNPAGKPKTKQMCYLPVREPGTREVNVNAVRNALSRIGQGFPKDASQSQRDSAKATLERLLSQSAGTSTPAARQAPEAVDEAADEDSANRLQMMVSIAENWIAEEDDPEDISTMREILDRLQNLLQTESTEAD